MIENFYRKFLLMVRFVCVDGLKGLKVAFEAWFFVALVFRVFRVWEIWCKNSSSLVIIIIAQ